MKHLTKLIADREQADVEIARLTDLDRRYSEEEQSLLTATDPEKDPDGMNILSSIQLKRRCVPGKIEQWEKLKRDTEAAIAAEIDRLVPLLNGALKGQHKAAVAKAAKALHPFYTDSGRLQSAAEDTDVARALHSAAARYSLGCCGFASVHRPVTAIAREFLAFATEHGIDLEKAACPR